MSGRPDGNRQDNRQRGNAAQLLEKYKALARDMQLAGDRVQTEYYLQFADHYFRVLEDGRSRFEEQDQRRRRDQDEDEGSDETVAADNDANEDEDGEEQRPAPRRDRNRQDGNRSDGEARGDRPQRNDRNSRPERADRDRPDRHDQPQRAERPDRPDRQEQPQRTERSERPARPRRDVAPQAEGEERIAMSVLPPAIGISSDSADMDAPRPRRRVRKPRDEEGNEEIAPAA
jgi:hypothetical protein